jgi:anti-sigma factor RsiW
MSLRHPKWASWYGSGYVSGKSSFLSRLGAAETATSARCTKTTRWRRLKSSWIPGQVLRLDLAGYRVKKRRSGMSTKKTKVIRRTAPILSAAATAGFLSLMGTAMASEISAEQVSQIVLSDDAEFTLVSWNNHHRHSTPVHTRRNLGKGAGVV